MNYFMRDFNAVSVFLTAGLPALAFGVVWSLYHGSIRIANRCGQARGRS